MKIKELLIVLLVILACCLTGCVRTEYKYIPTCPYGVSYMTKSDYDILSDPNKMSDLFVDWVIANNEFCIKGNEDDSKQQ